MIIAIERNKFNILYKYDQLSVGLVSVIDVEPKELESRISNQNRFETLVRELDSILPVFELDHEVLLLELDKSKVNFSGEMTISFNSVLAVYPLTSEGSRLLYGKLNENIRVGGPILEKAIQKVKADRTIRLRIISAKKLIDVFKLKVPTNQKFKDSLQSAIKSIVFKGIDDDYNILSYLLSYDKTPNYLPSGNAEFIIKVGVITLLSLNKEESIIKNGMFYKQCVGHKDQINNGSLFDGLQNFNYLLKKDDELYASYTKIIDSINPKFEGLDIFKITYYFIAIKSYLNNHEKNLLGIAKQLFKAAQKDPDTFIHVLLLIGYSFSFEELYESIHTLEQAPILKETIKLYGDISEIKYTSSQKAIEVTSNIKEEYVAKKDTNEKKSKMSQNLTALAIIVEAKENKAIIELVNHENPIHEENQTNTIKTSDNLIHEENQTNAIQTAENLIQEENQANTIKTADNIKPENEIADGVLNGVQNKLEKNKFALDSTMDMPILSVKDFDNWILENAPKGKYKAWKEFILLNFPVRDRRITLDDFMNTLSKLSMPESALFSTSGKAKFEKSTIVNGFFNKGLY